MIGRNRRLANQLDAALDGRVGGVPDELLALVSLADEIRDEALRVEADPSLANQRIERALRPGGRTVQVPRGEPRWAMRFAAAGLAAATAAIPAAIASGNALPGDPLYPLKRGIEEVRIATATSPEAEAALRTNIAAARLAELDALLASGEYDRLPEVLNELNLAVAEANAAVALAQQQGADSTQVAALASRLQSVAETQQERLIETIESLPPDEAEELEDIINSTPPPSPPPPNNPPSRGGNDRGTDGASSQPTSPPPTQSGGEGGSGPSGGSGSGTAGQNDPVTTQSTAPPTTEPPATTEPTTPTTSAPEETATPSAEP